MKKMLAFFPEGHDDELLYSILARYHLMTGNVSYKGTLIDLFGSSSICSVIDLPSHIKRLCNKFPRNNTFQPKYIIERHTLFPYYAPFVPSDRAKTILTSMLGELGNKIHYQAGIMASGVKNPKYLRYCPKCLKEEEENLGQAYWHRIHQVPGVFICDVHRILLCDSTVPFAGHNRQQYEVLNSGIATNTSEIYFDSAEKDHLLYIFNQVRWLLGHPVKSKSLNYFKEFYLNRLKELGFVSNRGRIKFATLLSAFTTFYGIQFLLKMDSYISANSDHSWLHRLLRKPRFTCHPLRHILLLRFLNESVSSLFSSSCTKSVVLPFGVGPWPCLNKAADHYKQNLVFECKIKINRESMRPLGTFICTCGYIYTRNGIDTQLNDRYTGRVKEFGELWVKRLLELSNSNYSMREIARRLGVDTNTVKKYLQLQMLIKSPTDKNPQKIRLDISDHRESWTRHLEKHASLTRTELRNSCSAIYTWLYRHDRTWLMENLPKPRSPRHYTGRVDWEKRDKMLASMVIQAIEDLLAITPPVRITTSRVGKYIHHLSLLEKHLNRLPITRGYLEKSIEPVDRFQVRRINFVAKNLREHQDKILYWELVRKSGLRPGYGDSVETSILYEMDQLQG
ncbi:TnsD family transposase [Brevibacillus porteri]|uniref:TnsD family transposase n=1 Tax=Brevibacillus porteri TaxID=2126350 RepID=UPI00362ADB38